MKNYYKKIRYISFFSALILVFSVSCTRTEPKITYGFFKLVQYQGDTGPQEYFSFFILAEDEDGFENLEEIYVFHDREQLRWHIKSDEWLRYTFEGKDWIGTRSIAVSQGSLPRGVFRVLLFNKGGEKTERSFSYDGSIRYPFPEIQITGGAFSVNSRWPANHLVLFDATGNYINTVTLESLSGYTSQLGLPSHARTAALWAEDEENFSSAFTNVVPIN